MSSMSNFLDYSLIIANNQWLINWLLIDYSLITNDVIIDQLCLERLSSVWWYSYITWLAHSWMRYFSSNTTRRLSKLFWKELIKDGECLEPVSTMAKPAFAARLGSKIWCQHRKIVSINECDGKLFRKAVNLWISCNFDRRTEKSLSLQPIPAPSVK